MRVFLLIAFSFLSVNRFAPEFLNADTILFPIMSFQHVTLFIWGQDRLANFIPYLLSFISSPEKNLYAHLMFFSISFFLLLFLCAQIIKKMEGGPEGGIDAFVITTLVACITLSPIASYIFILEGQPYALSYLLLLSSFLTFIRHSSNAKMNWTLITLSLFVATGLNPSVLVPAAGLSVGYILIKKDWRRSLLFVLISVAMFILWSLLSRWYGTPTGSNVYSAFSTDNIQVNFISAATSILSQIKLVNVSALLLATLFTGIILKIDVSLTSKRILSLVWIFALSWLLVFSNNGWIRLNLSHFRYFFPVFLVLIFTLSYFLYLYFKRLNSLYRIPLIVVCLVVISNVLVRPLVSFKDYELVKKYQAATQFALNEKVQFVTGNYWDAWPMVFQLQDATGSAFGLLYRGNGNAQNALQALNREFRLNSAAKVLCINSSIDACTSDIAGFTQRKWHVTSRDCGDGCKLLDVN